jgi:exopolysaccharide biosynthesis polyprenyl glycosylphosphotransferase
VGSGRAPLRDLMMLSALAGADALALAVPLMFTLAHRPPADLARGGLVLFTWIALLRAYGLHDVPVARISHCVADYLPALLHAMLLGSFVLWLVFLPGAGAELPFGVAAATAAAAIPLVLTARWLVARVIAGKVGPERMILAGGGPETALLASKIARHPEYRLLPIGVLQEVGAAPVPGLPVLGEPSAADFAALASYERVARVIIAPPESRDGEVLGLVHACRQRGVKVSLLPELSAALGPSTIADEIEGITLLTVEKPVFGMSARAIKRAVDVVIATIALVVTAPLMLLVALAVKLDSPGPVFYRQRRVGWRGHRFRVVKFRTMVRDAELLTNELRMQSTDPRWLKLDHDPRVTRVGRLLRLTSLDELPQLWNVLRGQMSLVGPRPLSEEDAAELRGRELTRFELPAGITGLWQVLGRTNIPFAEMVELDYLYVTNWSLRSDIRILLKTIPAVLTRRGAN